MYGVKTKIEYEWAWEYSKQNWGVVDIHYSVLEDLEGVRTLLYRILEEYDPDHY